MSMDDGFHIDETWWKQLTKEEAENPLPAICAAQREISDRKAKIHDIKEELAGWNSRLDFLRSVLRGLTGEKAP